MHHDIYYHSIPGTAVILEDFIMITLTFSNEQLKRTMNLRSLKTKIKTKQDN